MQVFIGRGRFTGRRGNSPANTKGLDTTARNRIDQLVVRQNDKHRTALLADPVYADLWIRSTIGYTCSCSPERHTRVDPEINTPALEKPTTDVVVRRVRGGSPGPLGDDLKSKITRAKYSQRDEDAAEVGDEEIEGVIDSIMGGDLNFVTTLNTGNDVVDSTLAEAFSTSNVKCGLCFGSGIVGGLSLWGGERILLDATKPVEAKGGATIDRTTKPNSFSGNEGGTLEWDVVLPTYFTDVMRVRVMDNFTKSSLIATADFGSGHVPLTEELLRSRVGQDNSCTVRVTLTDEQTNITHVEIVLRYTDQILLQLPNYSVNEGVEGFEPPVQLSAEVEARVELIPKGSLLTDSKNLMLWRVTSSTQMQTAGNQVFGHSLELRSVSKHEITTLLNLYQESYPLGKPYRGLEIKQGK